MCFWVFWDLFFFSFFFFLPVLEIFLDLLFWEGFFVGRICVEVGLCVCEHGFKLGVDSAGWC